MKASIEKRQIAIENWDGDGGIRIPDEALQLIGVDIGDSVYLIEEFIGTTRVLALSKTQRIHDRIDALEQLDREQAGKQGKPVKSDG
ncbi:AbrB/MazE/SpoVT family DNA-binding domain-containing protein [Pseudomonas pohangensis]|uniref:AbrB/MazE/SpoVT family DNA-binding domain-containing protein n=1 Tax=Pseudomonas pohangensis TaxID=364197 RepID=UPI001E5BFCF1|nr:AbrB/MazE/SpoVT family DNA-binding domain-containing protein [Pseudomonas pohangensis]